MVRGGRRLLAALRQHTTNATIQLLSPAPAAPTLKGPLSGLTVGIKDNFCTRDGNTTVASAALKDYQSPYDATVVRLLREGGATLYAKTNLDEFGMGSTNEHSHFGMVANPAGPANAEPRVAGGSSGGSAAAVAAGLCDVALGSDTGGSTRLPAAYCGVLGFKPSYGLLSRWGLVAYASSLDTVGIIGKRVEHVSRTFEHLLAFDEKDPTSIPKKARSRMMGNEEAKERLRGLVLGVPAECFPKELDGAVVPAFRRSVDRLKSQGATVVPVSLPSLPHCLSAYYVIANAEASSNLARYDGVRYGSRATSAGKRVAPAAVTRSALLGDEVQQRLLAGTFALTAEAMDNYFLQAQRLRQLVQQDFSRVFRDHSPLHRREAAEPDATEKVDALVFPAAMQTAPPPQAETPEFVQDLLNVPASLAGLPAISVPAGTADDGWPVGVQIASQWGNDRLVLQVAGSLSEAE